MIRSKKALEYQAGFESLLADLDKDLQKSNKPITVDGWSEMGGIGYEKEIFERLESLVEGSCFEDSLQLISGQKFPDIIANIAQEDWGFGVEAKTTSKDIWKSTGSSIVESTRVEGIEKIYLSFAKLGGTPEFLTKPYETCLSGVAVTHSPRYTIDMMLNESETIFSKVGLSYEEIRNLEKPFEPFKRYYTKDRDPNSVLWWADNTNESTPPILRVWSEVTADEKDELRLEIFLRFPEVVNNRGRYKYNQTSLWLASNKAIVASSLRDLFSAGGRVTRNFYNIETCLPKVIFYLFENFEKSEKQLHEALPENFDWESWSQAIQKSLESYGNLINKDLIEGFLNDAQGKLRFA